MAVMLYKKGDKHEIRGIKCEMKRFPIAHMHTALKAGFVTDPKQLEPKKVKPVKEKK